MKGLSTPREKKHFGRSFSQQVEQRNEQFNNKRGFKSLQAVSVVQQKPMHEKASLTKLLNNLIEWQNKQNNDNKKQFSWELLLIEQKRTMTGIKVKLKCKNQTNQLYCVIRISFNIQYFRMGKITQANFFIELDQINFQINKNQQKILQTQLEQIIKTFQSTKIYTPQQYNAQWVKQLFYGFQKLLIDLKLQSRERKPIESLNRKQIVQNYMLYHSPTSFAWSSKGNFCLTQNKIPSSKSSFIANPHTFKVKIQVAKVSQLNTVNQDQVFIFFKLAQNVNQQNQNVFFNWNISQQIDLLSLNQSKLDISIFYKQSNLKQSETKKKIASSNANPLKNDTVILDYVSKLSPVMRKIYQRYFIKNQHSDNRTDKLNVFVVCNQIRRYQDQMLYLTQRINVDKYKSIVEILSTNLLAGYTNILSANASIEKLKFFVISQSFKQQKFKLNNHFNLSLCFKAMIIENQYYSQFLVKYFKICFKMLKVKPPSRIYNIGSYIHFNDLKSESILIQLLEQYLKQIIIQKDKNYQIEYELHSRISSRIKKNIKVKKTLKFQSINQQLIISQEHRKKLIQTVLPILLVRDRNFDQFYYRQIQKIIATNAKMIQFYKNLIAVLKKLDEQKTQYIQQLVYQYSTYQDERKIAEHDFQVRRKFTIYCQKCQKASHTFQISQAQKLRLCKKCKI